VCENYEIFSTFIGEKIEVSWGVVVKEKEKRWKGLFYMHKTTKKGQKGLNYGHKVYFKAFC
jgi:hypothetical protein